MFFFIRFQSIMALSNCALKQRSWCVISKLKFFLFFVVSEYKRVNIFCESGCFLSVFLIVSSGFASLLSFIFNSTSTQFGKDHCVRKRKTSINQSNSHHMNANRDAFLRIPIVTHNLIKPQLNF